MSDAPDDLKAVAAAGSAPEPVDPTDKVLVARVLGGDETAFELLFERHRRFVAGVARRFFHTHEEVQDLTQETFTKAYFALSEFHGVNEKSFPAWLRRIATNAAYDGLRRTRRHAESSLSDLTEVEAEWLNRRLREEGADADVEQTTVARDLATKLLDHLAPDDRLVLTLLDGEECSTAEIAEITGWSNAKVKVRAHRARKNLRRVLKKFL